MDEYKTAGTMGDMAIASSLSVIGQPIGREQIMSAYQTLLDYKRGKTNLERKIVDNWQWYKLRQWDVMRKQVGQQVEPVSAWLFNSIRNKHADAMDNYPTANIQPHEESDEQEAKILSSIVPVLLRQCRFKEIYGKIQNDKLIAGTGVYGVFWDASKHNGLGDVSIEAVDPINLYWESGITDIQRSRNLFYISLRDNDLIEAEYPQYIHRLGSPVLDVNKYIYDDTIDTNNKSVIVDWYYKKRVGGRDVLHYCQFIAGQEEPLFATENEAEYAERGLYDHGLYPFEFDPLFTIKGTPCGFGYVDIAKSTQEYIDRGDQAIMQNMLFNAKPRHFIRNDGSVNEEEYADLSRDFVHVDGALGQDSVMPVTVNTLNPVYVNILDSKIDELKETTGNRDVSTGGTTGGATAASAIAAMQEAGSKLSRDMNQASYSVFEQVVYLVIELIRQFYDVSRQFRIAGENGQNQFVSYSNANIRTQEQVIPGGQTVLRCPMFDVEVTAEKASPYSKVSQNELALQLYTAGFFAPGNAEAALACLKMMDFDRKDSVMQSIQSNSLLMQQYQMLLSNAMLMANKLDSMEGTDISGQLTQQLGMGDDTHPASRSPGGEPKKLPEDGKESSTTAKARKKAAESTAPR